jgi:hypothetical protein
MLPEAITYITFPKKFFHAICMLQIIAQILLFFISNEQQFVDGQHYENSTRYNELVGERTQELFDNIGTHPLVSYVYYPKTLLLFRDGYEDKPAPQTSPIFGAPPDYKVNIIFDPCRNYEPGCCNDRYGTPEYIQNENTSSQVVKTEENVVIDHLTSRLGDQLLLLDEVCLGLETPLTVIDTCIGCLRFEIDQLGVESPVIYPLSECPPSTTFHCLDPTLYTADPNLLTELATPEHEIWTGYFGTDYISNLMKGGEVDYKIHCRERYKEYQSTQPQIKNIINPPLIDFKATMVLSLKQFNLEGKDMFFQSSLGGKDTINWVKTSYCGNWVPPMGRACDPFPFDPSITNGYYGRVDTRTTSLNISVVWTSGYVTVTLDDGLRQLPEILMENGVMRYDAVNFAVSPGKNTITVTHCASLIPNDVICDTSGVYTEYKFVISKPFYTCRRIVLYKQECTVKRVAQVQPYERPKCWDYNYTVVGENDCYWSNGTKRRYCISLGYSSTAYIYQCTGFQNNGEYNSDTHCGTYIEVHLPNITLGPLTGLYNKKQIEEVLIEVKLPPGLTSGYRSIPLPTQYKDFPRRILCRGSYQVWWVLRTPSEYAIEKRKNMYLNSPICDWDPFNKRYRPYATIARVDDYGALGPNPAEIGTDIIPTDAQIQFEKWWEEGYSVEEIASNKGFVQCDLDGENCNDATVVPPQRL